MRENLCEDILSGTRLEPIRPKSQAVILFSDSQETLNLMKVAVCVMEGIKQFLSRLVMKKALYGTMSGTRGARESKFRPTVTRMNFLFSKFFRGSQLQLSGVFPSNWHCSYSFLVFCLQDAVTGNDPPQEFSQEFSATTVDLLDERQITHLICARLKYDLYDFFRGVLGLLPMLFLV